MADLVLGLGLDLGSRLQFSLENSFADAHCSVISTILPPTLIYLHPYEDVFWKGSQKAQNCFHESQLYDLSIYINV